MNKYTILSAPCFCIKNVDDLKDYVSKRVSRLEGGYSVAINAEKIFMYGRNKKMKQVIDSSILPIPDGSGAVLALKWLHGVDSIRLDLPKAVFQLANREHYRMAVIGSTENVNREAYDVLGKQYSGIELVGRMNGFFDNDEIVKELLRSAKPQIVMLALGSPRQEKFAAMLNKDFPNILFVGCGGALDVLAGNVTRAPEFFQKNHLEWFYRLVMQPSRIRRQKVLPLFLFKLLIHVLKSKFK